MEGVAVLGLGFQAQQKHSVSIHLTAASCICAVVTIAYNTEGGWREGRASLPGQRPRQPGSRPCTPGLEDERRHLARSRANWPHPNHDQFLSIMPRCAHKWCPMLHHAGVIALQGSLPGGAARLEQLEPARASCPRLGRRPRSAEYAERISSGVRVANVKQMIYVTICFAS